MIVTRPLAGPVKIKAYLGFNVENITIRSLKVAILDALTSTSRGHKFNLIGRGSLKGDLERRLGAGFESTHRQMADVAFEELKAAGLIRSTYEDLVDPESWVEITESGRIALARRCLDKLDEALAQISPQLVEIRAGAWAAIGSAQPDAVRQAAHSGRELIDQALKEGAPDNEIRADPSFVPEASSKAGITRRHRIKLLMRKYRGKVSDSDLAIAEKAIDLMLALENRLISASHSRLSESRCDVRDALVGAEIALRRILGVQEHSR